MKRLRRGLAILLAVLLMMPTLPVSATEPMADDGTVKSGDISADDLSTEDSNADEPNAEDPNAENPNAEDPNAEDPNTEDSNTEDPNAEDPSAEDPNAEDPNAEDLNAEDPNAEDPNADDPDVEDPNAEDPNADDPDVEDPNADDPDAEDPENPDDLVEDTEKTEGENTEARQPAANNAAVAEEVLFNTGNFVASVVTPEVFSEKGDACFADDGSYTINIPEENPFFPYEVQFTCGGKVTNEWFMTPDDSVEIGGHTFYVSASFDGSVVTQISLNVAGETVVVYPKAKEFTDGSGAMPASLLPLTEQRISNVDLSAYTPAELTQVSVGEIFTGTNALISTDEVVWRRADTYNDEDYTISTSGATLDLSQDTCWNSSNTWEMIVGESDQLAGMNTRYLVEVETTASRNWLTPSVYVQDSAGTRTSVSVSRNEYYDNEKERRNLEIRVPSEDMKGETKAYIGLSMNASVFPNPMFDDFKIYEGQYETAEKAKTGKDITAKICSTDMTKSGAGYLLETGKDQWVTLVTYDAGGTATGCLPFYLDLEASGNYLSLNLFERAGGNRNYVVDSTSERIANGNNHTYTATLYKEYAADSKYYLTMDYYKAGINSSSEVTAAYVGNFESISKATGTNIKDQLFSGNYNTEGYEADFSRGIDITVFVGADSDADQEVYHYSITTKTGTASSVRIDLNSGTAGWFTGLKDNNGNDVSCYVVDDEEDSYGDYNYLTILVDANTDLTKLAPVFTSSAGAKLYTAGSSTPEVSGKSVRDFSKGPVQYSISAEDGTHLKNYWLQVVKATNGASKLYINSLEDPNSKTTTKDGVVYSTREMVLDGSHDNVHDILLANVGTEVISALSVELVSDTVVLDEYWTLNGKYDLSGFSTTTSSTSYGELPNLAKIRLKAKDNTEAGLVSGTLTIKSGTKTLMVLTLTGSFGELNMVTWNIPQAVKYVPYGTVIQNNNKYSQIEVTYSLVGGALPGGMEVKPNGEIYGVPTEEGTFTFRVRMDNNASFAAKEREFTLVVVENTDANVEAATDTGYELSQRVQDVMWHFNVAYSGAPEYWTTDSQTVVSKGEYAEFIDVYVDGEKLAKGTDYTSEAGSTRITIMLETLGIQRNGAQRAVGTHTIGIEFRTQDGTLKRAAQNYVITQTIQTGTTGATSGSSRRSSSSVSSAISNMMIYTVVPGDTLWKIAAKYYGDGQLWQKIFADNANTIQDPNRIYVGQQLVLFLGQQDGAASTNAAAAGGNTYTVQRGDTLWKIAQQYYGDGRRWRRIYDANTGVIALPERIYAGQILIIPN